MSAAVTVALLLGFVSFLGQPVYANTQDVVCQNLPSDLRDECIQNSQSTLQQVVSTVIDVLSWIIGILSVLVIVIAGFMYVLSAGNPDTAKKAKNAILYAIIGIVVAFAAQMIVRFVVSSV